MSTPSVTPQELGAFLDAVASAPVALRDVGRINSILARLVGLANQTGNIGVAPAEPSDAALKAAYMNGFDDAHAKLRPGVAAVEAHVVE